jgi:hypothetical protein
MNLTNQIPQNDPVDVAFDSTGVPGQSESCGDCGNVSLETAGVATFQPKRIPRFTRE